VQDDTSSASGYTTLSKTNELFLVFVRRDAAQEAPGPFVAGLAGPSHSRRGVVAGGLQDAPGVDGVLGTGGRGVWRCCRIRAWWPASPVCIASGFNNRGVIIVTNPLP